MRQLNQLQSVMERDVDLLLVEELHVSDGFRRWFLGLVLGPGGEHAEFRGVWHSVTHETGESDLELDALHEGTRCRVLIEDKLDADFQPDQVARYKSRAGCYIAAGECDRSRIVLVAPEAYLQGRAGAAEFDSTVSYEALRDWFVADVGLGERGRYKAKVIDDVVTAARRGWQPATDPTITSLCDDYCRYVAAQAPELEMRPRKSKDRPSLSYWVYFQMSDLHPALTMAHRLPEGEVIICVGRMGQAVAELKQRLAPYLDADMHMRRASESAGIYMGVPPIDLTRPLTEQMPAAAEGVAAARRLRKWAEQHHGKLGL